MCLQLEAAQKGLINLIPQLEALSVVLPPETLAWKLELLREGSRKVNKQLKSVMQRVLLLTSDQDLLLPSKEEGPRLAKALPRANHKVNHAHVLLAGLKVCVFHQPADGVPVLDTALEVAAS